MTQPPPLSTPPPAGPPPAGGGFTPPSGPYLPPPQYTPPPYAGMPAYPPGFVPPPVAPSGQPLAGFGDRFLAWLIDGALAGAVAMVIFAPIFFLVFFQLVSNLPQPGPGGTVAEPDPASMMTGFFLPMLAAELGILVLMLGGYWLYHVEYVRRTGGQTLGKKVMKLRIVPLDPHATLTRGILSRRYLVEFVGGAFLPFFHYLDGFWQLWDKPWQQCLHDKFAGTVVVKVAP